MILKLVELYNDQRTQKDLHTYLFEHTGIEIYELNLYNELIELESNEGFMKIWIESGSKNYLKVKYCLCKRPDIEVLLQKDEFLINDYELGELTDKLYHQFIVVDLWDSNKVHTHLLLNKRRFNIEVFNDKNIKIGEF